jgi:hypothetical protein
LAAHTDLRPLLPQAHGRQECEHIPEEAPLMSRTVTVGLDCSPESLAGDADNLRSVEQRGQLGPDVGDGFLVDFALGPYLHGGCRGGMSAGVS